MASRGKQRAMLFRNESVEINLNEQDPTKNLSVLKAIVDVSRNIVNGKVLAIKNIYGYPVLFVDDGSVVLVEPIIEGERFSTLSMSGRYFDVDNETIEDRVRFVAGQNGAAPKLLSISLFSFSAKENNNLLNTSIGKYTYSIKFSNL